MAADLAHALSRHERVTRATHGFHTYPAGLNPDAARYILRLFSGERVLDPFCGGGTVPVEAMLAGRQVVGSDVSEVATLVAWARTRRTDEACRTRLRVVARELVKRASHATSPPGEAFPTRVSGWYEPHVLAELAALRRGLLDHDEEPLVRDLLWAAFSSILVKVSRRRSDTSMVLGAEPRPPGTAAFFFHKRVREFARQLADFDAMCPPDVSSARIERADSREPRTDAFDLVLTSPPYPSVYDYLPIQDLREAWLGLRLSHEQEIGARRHWDRDEGAAIERWRGDTRAWMAAVAGRLCPGGTMVVVIGDGLARSGPIDARLGTLEAASRVGLRDVCTVSLARPDHARRDLRWEHIVVLRRRGEKCPDVVGSGDS